MDKKSIAKEFVKEVNEEYRNLKNDKIFYLFIDEDYNVQIKESLFMVKEEPHILGVLWRYAMDHHDSYWGIYPTYAFKSMFISDKGSSPCLNVNGVDMNPSYGYFYRSDRKNRSIMVSFSSNIFSVQKPLFNVESYHIDFIRRAIAFAKKLSLCKTAEEAEHTYE